MTVIERLLYSAANSALCLLVFGEDGTRLAVKFNPCEKGCYVLFVLLIASNHEDFPALLLWLVLKLDCTDESF